MKHRLSLLFSSLIALNMAAVPALRTSVTLTRADGSQVTAVLMGDEHFHYFEVPETGERLTVGSDGICHTMSATDFMNGVNRAQRRTLRQQQAVRQHKADYYFPETDGTPFDLTGEKRVLVIMVDFEDQPFSFDTEDFDRQLNEVGYSERGHHGSVRDYFYDQSYGQFEPKFELVGPIRMSRQSAFYGQNDRYGNEARLGTLVSEACNRAHDELGVDFSDYDWDGDGEAEMVVCLYAGYSEAQTIKSDHIWPLQWWLDDAKTYTDDGPGRYAVGETYVNKFLVINELCGSTGNELEGIGTFCHEYSHCLDLPDLYSTNGSNVFGMSDWDLMHSGNYLGGKPFSTPCAYTAYERIFCGWLTPTVLDDNCKVRGMAPITDAPECYIYYNEGNPDEYYLLQNLQQKGWNKNLPGHGLLVTHIDYSPEVWAANTVNNDYFHPRYTIIHADNNNYTTSRGLAGDPFPGSTNNTSLTDDSTPAAKVYAENINGHKLMGKALTSIAEMSGNIYFTFTNNLHQSDGIESIATDAPSTIYDLWGRRYNGQHQGLRIVDGKVRM